MLLGEDCARFIVAECRPRTTKKLMMSTIYHANISVMSTSCAQDTRPQPECHKLCSIPLSLKLISTLATSYIKMMTNCTASERVVYNSLQLVDVVGYSSLQEIIHFRDL